MKKLLALTLALLAIGSATATAQAADAPRHSTTVAANVAQQWPNQRGVYRRNNRRARVVTQTRTVRLGRRLYRETYQIRYLPNGRTQTRLISRVRIR